MTKIPKTIADLKINLTFSKTSNFCPTFTDFEEKFKKENPDLVNYRIKPGIYNFRIYIPVKKEIDVTPTWIYDKEICEWFVFKIVIPQPILQGDEVYLFDFLYRINYNIYLNIVKDTKFLLDWINFQESMMTFIIVLIWRFRFEEKTTKNNC